MALSSKALQKKRDKKNAKRKEVKKFTGAVRSNMPAEWVMAASAPVADVYTPEGLFETGLGSIWFSRLLEGRRYALGVFLVDTFCLGVKNAMYAVLDEDKYLMHIENFLHVSEETFVQSDPAYVRKLVESAAAYAHSLGFEPHPDYKIAKMIFGDVDASASDAYFTFGRDGNPCYVPGPGDTPAQQRRVAKQLERLHKDPYALLARGLNDD